MTSPDQTEAPQYFFTYIDQVPSGDIRRVLADQAGQSLAFLEGISEDQSRHRYAPDKWSIRESLGHVNDTERLFVFRAMWFARAIDGPLPSFDHNVAVSTAGSDGRSWRSHVEEFRGIRAATVSFFQNLPDEAWARRGVASGNSFSVNALAYITAGHLAHHVKILKTKYL